MSFSIFKENFTSGITSIRRRLSSSDIPSDVQDETGQQQQQQQQVRQNQVQQPVVASSGSQQQLSQPQIATQQLRPNVLSTQPQVLQQGGKMSSAPTSPQQTAVPTFARGLISAASNYVSAAVSSASTGKEGSGPGGTNNKGKTILVIDDETTEWAKIFRGKKVADMDVRIDQAEFRELHLVSMPRGDVVVEIHAQRGGSMVQRYLKPDMVLVRQHVLNDQPGRLANDDNRRLIVGLDTSGMPAVNSLASIFNFADRGWVYSNLLKIQRRFGSDRFPLIEKSFYANYQELIECPPTYKGPVVIKTGNGHVGLGKMKLEAGLDIREIAHLLMGSTTGGQSYLTVEPFIDARADIYIIKIGAAYKVYARKSAHGNWKATVGPHTLELVQLNERYKFWVDQCAELFGGLDVVAVSVLQAKDGREFIVEVKDSTAPLSLEGIHDDERRLIADLCVSKLNYFSRDATLRANSQQSSPAPQTVIHKQASVSTEPPKPAVGTPVAVTSASVAPAPVPIQAPVQQPQPQIAPKPPGPPLQTQAQQISSQPVPQRAPVPPVQPPIIPQQPAPVSQVVPPQPPASSHNPFLADLAAAKPSQQQPSQGMPPPLVPLPAAPPPPPGQPRAELPRQQSQGSVPPPVPGPPSGGHPRPPPPVPPPATRQPSLGTGPPPVPQPPRQNIVTPIPPPPPASTSSPVPPPSGQQPGRLGQLTNKSQSLMEDTEDTMKNLKKTFAGIFGEM